MDYGIDTRMIYAPLAEPSVWETNFAGKGRGYQTGKADVDDVAARQGCLIERASAASASKSAFDIRKDDRHDAYFYYGVYEGDYDIEDVSIFNLNDESKP